MKKLISLSLLALIAQAASASIIIQYDFNEESGAALGFNLPRVSPTIGEATEIWGPNVPTSVTNGSGQLTNPVTFTTTTGITLAAGRHILADTGMYELAYNGVKFSNVGSNDFLAFNFMANLSGSPIPETGPSPSSSGRSWLKVGSFAGGAGLDFSFGRDRNDINHATDFGTLSSDATYDFVIHLDTNAKELSFFYSMDGGDRVQIGSTLTGVAIGTVDGSGTGANLSYKAIAMRAGVSEGANILVDQVQLSSVIPEPSTYAIIGGIFVLGIALVRRRS